MSRGEFVCLISMTEFGSIMDGMLPSRWGREFVEQRCLGDSRSMNNSTDALV